MKEIKTIEQQVAELTEEQKDKILKIDKFGTIIVLVLTVPGILLMLYGLFVMVTSRFSSDEAFKGFLISGAVVFFISLTTIIFIKTKFPYYSDRKASYIRKMRKNK